MIALAGLPSSPTQSARKISAANVREDFNDVRAVIHYTRAAHKLGLWTSEEAMIARFFPDKNARLIEAGCGAGRVSMALWERGYRNLTAFDFAEELVAQAWSLFLERQADIAIFHADATKLDKVHRPTPPHDGALFMFNGLMQIPGRRNRRRALRQLRAVCREGAPLLFTTHDRDHSPAERAMWRLEAMRWVNGKQDPALVEFGDRYFEDDLGRTFMHLPDRAEILADLQATGWVHAEDRLRRELAKESRAVREFSDECRFWAATAGACPPPRGRAS
ncbi:MAG: class I SAM-dependent methyltransferase [Verrucomicrobiota bacterium]